MLVYSLGGLTGQAQILSLEALAGIESGSDGVQARGAWQIWQACQRDGCLHDQNHHRELSGGRSAVNYMLS